jgi:drug/metabolite transporter (DMT)-like permease
MNMSFQQLSLIVMTVLSLSVGQVLFKLAADELMFSLSALPQMLLNTKLWLALVVYFAATFLWLMVLKQTPLRVAYPFAAMAFVFVPVLAHLILGESVSWPTFLGAAIIILGVFVSTLDFSNHG